MRQTGSPRWRWWIGGLVGLVLCSAVVAGPTQPCRPSGFQTEVQCGTLQRPLDPDRPDGTHIDVHFVVVPAIARHKFADPVVFVAGGPGQSAIGVAGQLTKVLSRLNNRRDLVFVDQRGTGQSAPLHCDDSRSTNLAQSLDPAAQAVQMRQCLTQLQQLPYGDLRFFTTSLAVQDLDAVRSALGAPQVNLMGVSYGTRVVLDYLRQFPARVRRSVMDGVAPPDMALPSSASSDNQAVLDAVLAGCAQEPQCHKLFPRLRQQWDQLMKALPQTVVLTDPMTGAAQSVRLSRDMLLAAVRGPLYVPALSSALPYAIAQAAAGKFGPIMNLAGLMEAKGQQRIAQGMHLSVVCAEDVPRMALAGHATGADFGDGFAQFYTSTCAYWPRAAVPAAFYQMGPVQSPALLLTGGMDPVTPQRHSQRVLKALGPMAREILVPKAGHGVFTLGCMADVVYRFVNAEAETEALTLEANCAKDIPSPLAFVPVAYTGEPQ